MPKVLIIDDEADMRALMSAALGRHGFEVCEASGGRAGLDLARSERPDLVLSDVGMKDLDGYGVLSALRADPATAKLPVVLVTGLADLQGMREGMRLGADDYLPKPFTLDELVNAVRTRLEKSEALRREASEKLQALRSHISMMLPQELLNPLTGILGLAEILCVEADTLSPAEAADLGRDIQQSGERLHRLIRNFLIYSQIELLAVDPAKLQQLRASDPLDLRRPWAETALRVAADRKRGGDLALRDVWAESALTSERPPTARISEVYFVKLVEELFDNAFRVTPLGRTVRTSLEVAPVAPQGAGAASAGRVRLVVSDAGPGIPKEIVESLRQPGQFERMFYERNAGGLGLAIAVRLVEVHGGRVEFASAPGEGTTVTVDLPAA
jgi:two-component system sensor histidine kinase/response regulator